LTHSLTPNRIHLAENAQDLPQAQCAHGEIPARLGEGYEREDDPQGPTHHARHDGERIADAWHSARQQHPAPLAVIPDFGLRHLLADYGEPAAVLEMSKEAPEEPVHQGPRILPTLATGMRSLHGERSTTGMAKGTASGWKRKIVAERKAAANNALYSKM
jgi:hypothetical protein